MNTFKIVGEIFFWLVSIGMLCGVIVATIDLFKDNENAENE
jgi:hypothetical protein